MYFQEFGANDKPTTVFVHGGGVASWMWKKQLDYFSRNFHILLPDLPGHGASLEQSGFSKETVLDELQKLIKNHTMSEKAPLVGHSLGAKLALQFAAKHSGCVLSVVAASSLWMPLPMSRILYNDLTYKLTKSMVKKEPAVRSMAKKFHFPELEMEDGFVRETMSESLEVTKEEYQIQIFDLEVPQNLEELNLPVLLIAGEKEPGAMKESAVFISNLIPGSQVAIIPNAQHNYPWVNFDEFNGMLDGFLQNI